MWSPTSSTSECPNHLVRTSMVMLKLFSVRCIDSVSHTVSLSKYVLTHLTFSMFRSLGLVRIVALKQTPRSLGTREASQEGQVPEALVVAPVAMELWRSCCSPAHWVDCVHGLRTRHVTAPHPSSTFPPLLLFLSTFSVYHKA